MALSEREIEEIAEKVADRVMETLAIRGFGLDERDVALGEAMGAGAIALYGREQRREPCACCLIDPQQPSVPENRMCTTKGAIGTLSDREEEEWCSEIIVVGDGRCERARSIRTAAKECKELHPEDTQAFFECYAPAFSGITRD